VRRTGAESARSCPSPAAAATGPTVPSLRKKQLPSFLPLVPTRRCREPGLVGPLLALQLLSRLRPPLFLSAAPAAQPDTPETHIEQRTTSRDEFMVSHWSGGKGWPAAPLPSSSCSACRSLRRSLPPSAALSAAPPLRPTDRHPHTTHRWDRPLRTCFQPLSAGLTWGGGGGVVLLSGSGGCSACSRSELPSLGGRLSSTPPTRKGERRGGRCPTR
jgi:hypothetical protein